MLYITASSALWFAPFVIPVCIWAALNDLRDMKIPNASVYALVAIFVVIGLIALPLSEYPWRLLQLVVVLVFGIILNAIGAVGAGDAKFAAAAAPFVAYGDLRMILALFAANMLAAFAAHRIAKYTSLRKLAPNWLSWDRGSDFPMGLSLGATLALYLLLGCIYGR